MRFLVDNQLPLSLARFLAQRGHEADHVSEVGLDNAPDVDVWTWAQDRSSVVVSKDEDFFFLANRSGDQGRILWVRLGNCRTAILRDVFERTLESVVAAFASGQRIVELL